MDIAAELELKRTAERVYRRLFLLPVLSVPWFLFLGWIYSPYATSDFPIRTAPLWEKVVTSAIPAVPYLLGLFLTGTSAKHVFVKRHAQQGLALAIFALFLNRYFSQDLIVFFWLFNGVLWFFGRSTGLAQVNEGVGMFVKQPERLSRRPIKELELQLNAREDRGGSPAEKRDHDGMDQAPAQIAAQAFARGEALLATGWNREAVEVYLEAFRMGDPAVRELAIRQLEAFGELEEF